MKTDKERYYINKYKKLKKLGKRFVKDLLEYKGLEIKKLYYFDNFDKKIYIPISENINVDEDGIVYELRRNGILTIYPEDNILKFCSYGNERTYYISKYLVVL